MPIPALTPYPDTPPPTTADPATFDARGDVLSAFIPPMVEEINAFAAAANAQAVTVDSQAAISIVQALLSQAWAAQGGTPVSGGLHSARDYATSDAPLTGGVSSAKIHAQNAASDAAASAAAWVQVQQIYDQFDDRYLGPKAVDPSTDNDGNALADGAFYIHISTGALRAYTAAAGWTQAVGTVAGVTSINGRNGQVHVPIDHLLLAAGVV